MDKQFKEGGRYLVSENYIESLTELRILEVSEEAIKVKFDNGNSQWYLKDKFPYRFVGELPVIKQTIEDRSNKIQFDDDWYEKDEPQFNLKLTEENDIDVKLKSEEKPKLEWQSNPPEKPMTWEQANAYAKKLGDGWRLPTIEELKEAYDNKVESFQTNPYWSSSLYNKDISNAWYVNFLNGKIFSFYKNFSFYVRCVRDVENKIVEETEKPKLEWEPNPYKNSMTWDKAMAYAKSLGDGWRLPTVEELREAYDNTVEGFKPTSYWSSSTCAEHTNRAEYINFSYGYVNISNKLDKNYVRCVRDVKL